MLRRVALFAFLVLVLELFVPVSAEASNTAPYIGGTGDGWFELGSGQLINNAAFSNDQQIFSVGQASTAMSQFNIYFGGGVNATAGTPLKITIPSGLAMTWDNSITNATLGGSAAADFSASVSYSADNKTLIISVLTGTSDGDSLTISGLNFTNFSQASSGLSYLTVDVNNDGVADLTDANSIFIARTAGPGNIYNGGLGQGWSMSNTGAFISAGMSSASAQLLPVGGASTPMSTLVIYFGGAAIPTSSTGLNITIPSGLAMTWDSSITSATLGGSAAADFSASVSYSSDLKTVILAVTGTINNGDSLTISGLNFTDFTQASTALSYLTADTNNDGVADLTDNVYKMVIRASGSGSIFNGGTGDGWFMLENGAEIGPYTRLKSNVRLGGGVRVF